MTGMHQRMQILNVQSSPFKTLNTHSFSSLLSLPWSRPACNVSTLIIVSCEVFNVHKLGFRELNRYGVLDLESNSDNPISDLPVPILVFSLENKCLLWGLVAW